MKIWREYTLYHRMVNGQKLLLERLLPGHPEGPYRFHEDFDAGGSYISIDKRRAVEVLQEYFGMGRSQSMKAVWRAERWAKETRYEFFPGWLDANSSSTASPADGSHSES